MRVGAFPISYDAVFCLIPIMQDYRQPMNVMALGERGRTEEIIGHCPDPPAQPYKAAGLRCDDDQARADRTEYQTSRPPFWPLDLLRPLVQNTVQVTTSEAQCPPSSMSLPQY